MKKSRLSSSWQRMRKEERERKARSYVSFDLYHPPFCFSHNGSSLICGCLFNERSHVVLPVPSFFVFPLFPFNSPLIFSSVLTPLYFLSFSFLSSHFLSFLFSSPLLYSPLSSLSCLFSFPYPSSPFNSYFLISLSLIFSTLFFPFPISPLLFFLFPFLLFSFISTHLLSSSLFSLVFLSFPFLPFSLLLSIFLPINPKPPVPLPLLSSPSVL